MRCPFCLTEVTEFAQDVDASNRPVLVCPDAACREVGVPMLYAQDYEQFPAIPFSIIGLRGHGKTVFLTSLLHEFAELGKRWPEFYSAPLDEESFKEVEARLAEMRAGRLPEATRMVFPRAEILRLQHIPRVGGCHLMMFDTSGEAFQTVNGVMSYARYVKRSSAVVWLISLENMESPEELDRVLTVYLQALAEMNSDARKQELIVVLTKGDLLLTSEKVPELPEKAREFLMEHELDPRTDSWLRLDRLSRDLKDWLLEGGYHQFVNRAEDSFAAVRCCIISAQGADAPNGELTFNLMPRGVLAPLFWLWRQLAPPVWVEAPDDGGVQLFFSLEDAFAESEPDSTIHLSAMTYRLREPLQIRQGVRLKGRGGGKTIIRGSAEGYDVAFGAAGERLEVEGVLFQHEGPNPADVFRAIRGEVVLRRCGFKGGVAVGKEMGGDGLVLSRDVSGLVSECEFGRNQGNGISLRDQCTVKLENNQSRGNAGSGIFCLTADGPTISGNTCSGNQTHGIRIGGSSLVKVIGNTCQGNKRAGISSADSAQPELRGNQCLQNGLSGIQVKRDSKPVVESNRCLENRASGISFTDAALGTATDNECDDNAHCGIALADQARSELNGNRCHRNGQHGINFTASSAGSVAACQCFANSGCGINIEGEAGPNIEDNECSGNQGHGICIASSVGKIRIRGTKGQDNRGELVRDFRRKGWFG
jgi:parallel beta-helix repeat protein